MGTRTSRGVTAALAALVLALGLAAHGLLPAAAAGPAGDALYATLVVLLVALVRPRATALAAGVVGLAVSAAVEALQLTGVPAAVVARVPVARYVLGTTFAAGDLAWYAVGAALGAAVLALCSRELEPVAIRHRRTLPRRRGQAATWVAAPLVMLLAAGGAVAWTVRSEALDLRDQLGVATATLTGSAGRVDDESTRRALADAIGDAQVLLAATPLLERRPGDAAAARDRVEADVADVTASRLAHARAAAAAARDALAPLTSRGDEVLTATKGLGADPKLRTALSAALDGAATTAAAAADDQLAAAVGPERVEQTAADLATASTAVGEATKALLTAQDAITCPYPDQLWFPEAGKLDPARLAPIPWAPGFAVRKDVLPGLVALDDAFRARFGHHLPINSAYRTYKQQVAVYDPAHPNPLAAPPGCSNHGLGTAVDIDGISTAGSAQYAWLKAHAKQFGWTHPDWAEPTGRLPEPWHWQSVKTPTSY